jgi:hypothetical protein
MPLNPRQFKFLYHEAHLKDRESIRSTGLRAGKEWSFSTGEKVPGGVYLSPHGSSEYGSSMHDSSHFGYDRWRVNVQGLDIQQDPTQPNSALYHSSDIPVDRIKLVKRGHPNWEKHI